MTDTTATFYESASFDSRIFFPDEYRRVVRLLVNGVVIGLATVGAVCVLVTTVTFAAAWIVNIVIGTEPVRSNAAFAPHHPKLASAAAFPGLAWVATDPANALTFEAKWDRITVPAFTRSDTGQLLLKHPIERRSDVASLTVDPLRHPQGHAKAAIAHTPDSKHAAGLIIAAGPAFARPRSLAHTPNLMPELPNSVPLPRPHPAQHEIVGSPIGKVESQVAAIMPPTSTPEKRVTLQDTQSKSTLLPDPESRTAVYDIAAHTVYLPNGERLEAHSGLGDKLDDPRYVSIQDRGPTPPNVYDLTLREQLFHDVRAIRLNPVGDGSMFGRAGMLAHPYMLGANGQSNGCVSFKDYPAFLDAYLRGEVERLVVVPHLGNTSWRTADSR
jgi:hypothetical protein